MELPAPDPNKLLQSWMEWERGEVTPGRVMANLKTGGLRQLLEEPRAAATVMWTPLAPTRRHPTTPAETVRRRRPASWSPVV